jgi:ATP-binding cassette subfamily F protein 3
MLSVSSLKKSYSSQYLFEDVSFIINPGERVGLVGRNGHGKSTLLKLILNQEEPDSGTITTPKNYKIGHLSQHLVFTEANILDECCLALPLLDGCWKETYKAEALLHGLGFHDQDFTRAPSEFSGGYQIRLNLVKLLLTEPNLLLLDEPTNYLDIVSLRWLARFLIEFEGEILIITHDRAFMDSVTTHTLGIHRGKVKKVEGPTEKLYELLAEEEDLYEKTRLGEEKRRKHIEQFVDRFRAKASKAKAVQSRVKLLEKIPVKEELMDIQDLEFSFSYTNFPGKFPLNVNSVSFGYEQDSILIPEISFSVGKQDRIAIIGPNGKGKTTLLNLVANEITPNTGSVVYSDNTKLSYFGQTNVSRLQMNRTIEEELWELDPNKSRTVIRNVCGSMMFEGDAALKKISVLSGGERSRVLLGKILLSPSNLLLLDEPTNHLDMHSIEALIEALESFPGAIMIVTHSEEIIHRLATRLVVFDRGTVELFEGSYEDFLRLRGWEDEDEMFKKERTAAQKEYEERKNSMKDQKLAAKRNQNTEKEILEKESLIEQLALKLTEATKSGNSSLIQEISINLHKNQVELENLYNSLE